MVFYFGQIPDHQIAASLAMWFWIQPLSRLPCR